MIRIYNVELYEMKKLSIGLLVTTEAMIADKPDDKDAGGQNTLKTYTKQIQNPRNESFGGFFYLFLFFPNFLSIISQYLFVFPFIPFLSSSAAILIALRVNFLS